MLIYAPRDGTVDDFEGRGYMPVRDAVSRDVLSLFYRYALSYLQVPGYFELERDTISMGRYADAFGEVLLTELQPTLERHTARKLIPAYSFLRFYTPDSRLKKHVDRPSCEISATLTVGYEGTSIWPIFVESSGRNIGIELDVGDLLVYRGPQLPHWREALATGHWLQLFLHYVEAEGNFTGHKFDRRTRLGPWSYKK